MPIFVDNRDLLDRFRRGERAALTAVYERYVDEVATLARRGFTMESQGHVYVPGTGRDGEHELVQETFIRAFADKARQAYDGLRPYRPFLLRITKNLMIDRHRSRRRGGVHLDGAGVGDIDELLATNDSFSAEEARPDPHWQALARATGELVAELDPESRTLVQLRFDHELSQDAVAEAMGCSRRRVRTLEERVQKLLRRRLRSLGLLDT